MPPMIARYERLRTWILRPPPRWSGERVGDAGMVGESGNLRGSHGSACERPTPRRTALVAAWLLSLLVVMAPAGIAQQRGAWSPAPHRLEPPLPVRTTPPQTSLGPGLSPLLNPKLSPQVPYIPLVRPNLNTSLRNFGPPPPVRTPRALPNPLCPDPEGIPGVDWGLISPVVADSIALAALGVQFQSASRGLQVGVVTPESLAAAAGVRAGDEILAVDRQWTRSRGQLVQQLRESARSAGRAWVLVRRDGQQRWVNLAFAEAARPVLGVQLVDNQGTVRITDVAPGSVAARAGLHAGDEVITLNGSQVSTGNDLVAGVEGAARTGGEVVLQIRRDGVERKVPIGWDDRTAVAPLPPAADQPAVAPRTSK